MGAVPYLSTVAALAALALAYYFSTVVLAEDEGTDLMKEIGAAIREGAMAFLRREYRWVSAFVAAMTVLIFAVLDYGRPWGAIAYVNGALFSSVAGYIGMTIATRANTRTANAAMVGGANRALPLAFRGGAVMGFTVAGLGLLGLSFSYLLYVEWLDVADPFSVITAFGLGGSSVALFARIGGGIYTKAADVGADLVGKVEAGIPEDDPRNPATIADNVGDNVGDVAGMGADLFESYAGALVAPMALAFLSVRSLDGFGSVEKASEIFDAGGADLRGFFVFPLLVAAIGMVGSIIGSFFVRGGSGSLAAQLHRGTNVGMAITAVLAVGGAFWAFDDVPDSKPIYMGLIIILGLFAGWAIGFVSEFFTSDHYGSVKRIAKQAETGPATVTIGGIAEGKMSTAPSVLLVVAAIGGSYWLGEKAFPVFDDIAGFNAGIYGVAVAAIGMLATTGVVVAVDAYGPISDNAGGIAEMAELPKEVRQVTDSLDSLGNTTAAVAKGFAIGSAAITALALFKAFEQASELEAIDIGDVEVTMGLFVGAMVPFVFAALTMQSVGRAAQKMIVEVRRQFAEIPGLREGRAGVKPDYARCVDISTAAALKEMVLPGALAIALPLGIGLMSVKALGGFLAGALVTGFLLAIYMANAGGAWDNAKKYIEAGNQGGKGSDAHRAAVVGDTIGDPFKDTSGPAMNILIKVMTIVALVFVPVFI
ncbi:MAG: sodium-translocating pyrophosphatase [Acidimicrobiia bacterium]